MAQKVFVVMGNDFPDAAFSTEAAANAYVERKKAEPRPEGSRSRIYWRAYDFVLDQKMTEGQK